MIVEINESKTLIKHIFYGCICKFKVEKCNLCQCKCKKTIKHICQKHVWNPSK